MIPITRQHQARLDIIEIAESISRDNILAADRFLDAVESTIKSLAEPSQRGAIWEPTSQRYPGLRWVPVKGFHSYLVFFVPREDRISVIRILHGARDLDRMWED